MPRVFQQRASGPKDKADRGRHDRIPCATLDPDLAGLDRCHGLASRPYILGRPPPPCSYRLMNSFPVSVKLSVPSVA